MERITTKNPKQTEALGKKLADRILKGKHGKQAHLVLLYGDLGGGKTTFIKGFARALGITRVMSPTFIMSRKSKVAKKQITHFFHMDLYRFPEDGTAKDKERMLEGIGFTDALQDPTHVLLVEWAERIAGVKLPKHTKVRFRYGEKESERAITIS